MPTTRSAVRVACWVALILTGASARSTRAELLYFAKGGQVQMPATVEGPLVRLETPDGPVEFDRTDFRKIVPGYCPEKEWDSRLRAARAGDSSARFAAAWWALENGLTPQAEALLRESHASDPKHQPTARMVATLDHLDRPVADPDLTSFRQALGLDFVETSGPHVVLLHRHELAEARERIDLLERVVRSYYLLFAAHGLDLIVPTQKLASAWFPNRADYQAFLREHHAGAFRTTRGYFHPTLNAVVAYDSRDDVSQKKARDAIAARRQAMSRLTAALNRLPPGGRMRIEFPREPTQTLDRPEAGALLRRLEREVRGQEVLLETDRRALDLGTAAHEMVHQLVAASGLARQRDDFPTWLHEGFAAQFEVIRGGRWAGISRAHDLRLPDWHAIHPQPRLLPVLRDEGFSRGYQRDLYAESWALVYYLRQKHPQRFLDFIDLLRGPRTSEDAGDRVVSLFRSTFGTDLESFDQSWSEYLDSVATPLEEGPTRPEESSRSPPPSP